MSTSRICFLVSFLNGQKKGRIQLCEAKDDLPDLQMAHNMSEKDFVQLRNLFIKIDKNNDGTITSNELREYFKMNQNSLALKHHSVNLGTI